MVGYEEARAALADLRLSKDGAGMGVTFLDEELIGKYPARHSPAAPARWPATAAAHRRPRVRGYAVGNREASAGRGPEGHCTGSERQPHAPASYRSTGSAPPGISASRTGLCSRRESSQASAIRRACRASRPSQGLARSPRTTSTKAFSSAS